VIYADASDLRAHFKVELKAMSHGTVEIISGRERRRRWGLEEKLWIVAATHEAGACVREVAARHDVYRSLLHNWRRQVREGRLGAPQPARFVPVRLTKTPPIPAVVSAPLDERRAAATIEIILPDGSRLRVGNDVSLPALRRVMTALRG
jgi:transposase